jgi:hypothetical protein
MSDQSVQCTLLIWEIIPEETKLFLIPNHVADQYVQLLDQAHNKFVNFGALNPGLEFLNYAVLKEKGVDNKNARGVFANYEVDKDMPLKNVLITRVYLSGFGL